MMILKHLSAALALFFLGSCGGSDGAVTSTPATRTSPTVTSANNIVYANGQQLDLFIPRTNIRRTAMIFVHGGGFTQGDKKDLLGHAKLFSDGGFVTATINYHLAPASPAPAAMNDVTAAVRWIKGGGGGRGLKVDKVILVGYSAGGTLAMMAGLKNKSEVAAVISAAGVSNLADLARSTPHVQLKSDIADYLQGTTSAAASPINQPLRAAPPFFLIHGDQDDLVPIAQSVAMAQKLKASGNKLLFKVVPGVGHEILLPNPKLAEILRDISKYAAVVDAQ